MRVAYRRDCIKLRNHPVNKAVGRVPMALIRLCGITLFVEKRGCKIYPTHKGKYVDSKRRIYQANTDTSFRHTIICLKAHD